MNRLLSTTLLVVLLLLPRLAHAAAWPDNWLGPPDNHYVNLRLGVFYYGAVLDDIPDDKGMSPLPLGGTAPDGSPLPQTAAGWLERLGRQQDEGKRQADVNLVRSQLQETARFYWRNTRFNCALTFDYVNQDADEASQPILRSSLDKADAPYYTPLAFSQDDRLRADPSFDGLLQIIVLYRYNPQSGQLERVSGGGGFTEGAVIPVGSLFVGTSAVQDSTSGTPTGPVRHDPTSGLPTQKQCGYSWWIAPPQDNVCGSDWLLCHEFGHQLDSLFEQSGHPEFWFNHLARSEANIARFGEHFDCMAYILRRTPEVDWRDLKWGEQRTFTDADHDSVPDRDDWLEHAGLMTDPNPAKADTDGDGLSDYAEFMAMNGNVNGHGERLYPALHEVDATMADSDGDGIPDGYDPVPYLPLLYAFIPRLKPGIEATWSRAPGWPSEAEGFDPFCELELQSTAIHSPLAFKLAFAPDDSLECLLAWGNSDTGAGVEDASLRVSLDLDNDGWFNGDDNYRIEVDGSGITRFIRNKAASDTAWPAETPLDSALVNFTALPAPAGYLHACALRLEHGKLTGLQCKPGERIGINIGVKSAGEQWFYTIAEPNSLLPLELR
jgi:hypothetical protein